MLNAVIDLSHHNSHVDFAKLKAAGIVGVIHKATQGTRMIDPRYAPRKALAKSVGLLWGAYHFGIGGDGSDQADHFLESAQPDDQTLLVLDFEPNPTGTSMSRRQAREFIEHVQTARGPALGLYTGAAMVPADLLEPVFGQCFLWWAQYGMAPSRIPKRTWPSWTLWQYTDGAVGPQPRTVDGVGPCDRNQFNGDLAGLQRLWNVPQPEDAGAEVKIDGFLTELTELSRQHGVGISDSATLFILEDVDQDRVYSAGPDSKLVY